MHLIPALLLHLIVGGGDSTKAPPAPIPHHPHDIISAVAFAPGYPEDPRMFVASPGTINLFLVSEDRGLTWRPSRSGIRGQVFREIVLASDWETSGVTYVVTEDGGLQISENAGKTWADPVCNKRLRLLAVPPVQKDGTRPVFFASNSTVFASFDGGATHREVLASKGGHVESIAVSRTFEQDQTVFVGTSDARLLVSTDAGKTWSTTKLPAPPTHVELSPAFDRDHVVWVSTWGEGVHRSADGGKSFTECSTGLSDREVNQVRAVAGASGYELFACTREAGVFHSMDDGQGWTLTSLRVEKTTQTTNHYTSLAISPAWPRDKTVLSGTFEGLNISHDGGTTWRESNVNPPRIGRIVNTSPTFAADQHVFACGYGMHLLVSENAADDWEVRFTGMDAGSVYDICAAPDFKDSKLVMTGVYEGVRRSVDAGKTWQRIQFADYEGKPKDGYTTRSIRFAPGYPEDKRVFAIGTRGLFVRSDDLGETWTNMGVITTWATSVELSPEFETDNTIFVGGTHIWRSDDAGATFTGPLFQGTIYAEGIIVPPDFGETGELYTIAKYRGFAVGSRRGDSWTEYNDGLDGYIPSDMKLSPDFANDDTIYLLTSGGGLFRSTNRGRRWERVSELGGPIDQGFTMAFSPEFASDKTMFVGSFDGIWRSRDGGVSWTPTTNFELYDEKRDPWQRHGDWQKHWGGTPVNNTVTRSRTPDDTMEISFEGIACKLIGVKGPEYGIASVSLDGGEPIVVDQYSKAAQYQQVMFEASGLESRSHRIVVRVTGDKHESASAAFVGVDALEVTFRR